MGFTYDDSSFLGCCIDMYECMYVQLRMEHRQKKKKEKKES
jgi:hypothetical protein